MSLLVAAVESRLGEQLWIVMESSPSLVHHHLHGMMLLLLVNLNRLLLEVVNLGRILLELIRLTRHILRFNLESLFVSLPVVRSDLAMILCQVGARRHLLPDQVLKFFCWLVHLALASNADMVA